MNHTKKTTQSIYKRRLFLLIIILSLFKIFLAFNLELGNDEAYYWMYSQHLKWNYFDHPPMVAFWIRIFTLNLLLEDHEGFLRLGSIVGSAMATFFIFKAVATIHSERAGWFAAILYNASFYAGLTAGLYIMPDSPQMVFWTLSLWMIARIIRDENNWLNWILFGVATGLCIMSKVHGAFIWIGFGLYILIKQIKWLLKPQLYIAAVVTAIIISPILIWNIQHNFITYRFHTDRVVIEEFDFQGYSFIREIRNHFIFNNPVNVVMIIAGLFTWRKYQLYKNPVLSAYTLIGVPMALFLLFISIFRDTILIHWSGPAYVSLLPVAAVWLASLNKIKFFPNVLKLSLGIFVITSIGWMMIVNFYPGTFGSKKPVNYGMGDISLDIYGWEKASEEFEKIYKSDLQQGIMPANTPLVATYWWGAHVEYYFGQEKNIPLFVLGSVHSSREYWWVNRKRIKEGTPDTAYCIMPSDETYSLPIKYYSSVELAKVIEIERNNKPAHYFKVYRLKGWKGKGL